MLHRMPLVCPQGFRRFRSPGLHHRTRERDITREPKAPPCLREENELSRPPWPVKLRYARLSLFGNRNVETLCPRTFGGGGIAREEEGSQGECAVLYTPKREKLDPIVTTMEHHCRSSLLGRNMHGRQLMFVVPSSLPCDSDSSGSTISRWRTLRKLMLPAPRGIRVIDRLDKLLMSVCHAQPTGATEWQSQRWSCSVWIWASHVLYPRGLLFCGVYVQPVYNQLRSRLQHSLCPPTDILAG